MRLYRRPEPPQGFPSKKWDDTRQAAEQLIEAELKKNKGKKSTPAKKGRSTSKNARKKKKEVFPGIWKDYKAVFAYAQFGKCGFCESSILETSFGDVEHYHPKSAISALREDANALGQQQEASAGVTNRLVDQVSSFGYYWLAYDWSNYLLACSMCNGLKGTIFPVKNDPRSIPPLRTAAEEALLLNPFEKKSPARHLKFQVDGWVTAKTVHGRATIETCGLYRDELLKAREKIAVRVYRLAGDIRGKPNAKEHARLLADCYEFGADDAEHCGMVRSIIEEVAGISWDKLVTEHAQDAALESKRTRNAERKKVIDERLEMMGRERYEHSAAVREIFEKTCGISWGKLVARHAQQLAADFMACKKDWEKDTGYQRKWKKKFYLLARDNLSELADIRAAYEKKSHMDWNELKADVEAGFKFLWKLPDDTSGTSPTSSAT